MNRCLLAALLLFLTCESIGQKILFTDATNTWKVYASGKDYLGNPFSAAYHYYYSGDTLIKGANYKRLASYSVRLTGSSAYPRADIYFVREDTLAGKVWCRTGGNGSAFPPLDTTEKLIYNRSWAMNDTVINESLTGLHFYINSIDSVQINGVQHRVFGLRTATTAQPNNYYYIVEGLGSNIGPGYAFTGGAGLESDYRLNCFFNRGIQPALNPALSGSQGVSSFSNTNPCNLSVEDDNMLNVMYLYPNPVTKTSRIVLSRDIESGELSIYDIRGCLLAQQGILHSSSILLPEQIHSCGLYYYRIADTKTGLALSGKFVVE